MEIIQPMVWNKISNFEQYTPVEQKFAVVELLSRLKTHLNSLLHYFQDICKANSKNTRDTFDVKEQRLDGTDAEAFKDVEPASIKAKNKWKKTHSNMINAIKEAKKNRPPTAMKDINVQLVTK